MEGSRTGQVPTSGAQNTATTVTNEVAVSKIQVGEEGDQDGLELQIAIDSLAVGNTEPLRAHLARLHGFDGNLEHVRLIKEPFDLAATPNEVKSLQYIGEMDNIGETDTNDPNIPIQPVHVVWESTDHLYEYKPLTGPETKTIRLVRLGPKDEAEHVHAVELQTFQLKEAPRFYAISYVWGDPEKKMSLPCQDGRIMITQNLYRALDRIFLRYPDVWIWADGICINQEDVIERGHQVSLMGEIYTRAAMVVAHMGHHRYELDMPAEGVQSPVDTSEDSSLDMSKLELPLVTSAPTLHAQARLSGQTGNFGNYVDTPQTAISLMNYLSRIWSSDEDYTLKGDKDWEKRKLPQINGQSEKIWLRLFEFWNEDWFYRSWVLQEAVLGKKVIILIDDTVCSLDFVMNFWHRAKTRDIPELLKMLRF